MKNRRFIFFASLSFSLFVLSFSLASAPASAQDAIQCTPGDVNLSRNLKFVNPASNNIYLGTGKLNFSANDANLYATNDSGNLLLKSPANILFQSNNDFLFKNSDGTQTLAGIYSSGAPAAADNSRFLIVNGKIEGWQVNGLNQICVQGKCLTDWPTSCGGTQKLIASGSKFSCSDDLDTDTRCDASSSNCIQLCIGTDCYDSWASAVQGGSGVSGSGETNQVAKWTGSTSLGDSIISDDGSSVTINGGLTLTSGDITFSDGTTINTASGGNWTLSGTRLYPNDSSWDVGLMTPDYSNLSVAYSTSASMNDLYAVRRLIKRTTFNWTDGTVRSYPETCGGAAPNDGWGNTSPAWCGNQPFYRLFVYGTEKLDSAGSVNNTYRLGAGVNNKDIYQGDMIAYYYGSCSGDSFHCGYNITSGQWMGKSKCGGAPNHLRSLGGYDC